MTLQAHNFEEIQQISPLVTSRKDSHHNPDMPQIESSDMNTINMLGFLQGSSPASSGTLGKPVADLPYSLTGATRQLCQVYLRQVDPIIKILHRPSLHKWMVLGEGYLTLPKNHESTEALSMAICYVATCSMTDLECHTILQTDKKVLQSAYRKACEVAIGKSDLLATRNIAVLQAFVLYLVSPPPP